MHGKRSLDANLHQFEPELNRLCRQVKATSRADPKSNHLEESSRETTNT